MIGRSSSFSKVASRILDEYPDRESPIDEDLKPRHSIWLQDKGIYVNRETDKLYKPHNQDEMEFITRDYPRRWLLKGGEGSGKSVAGVIKDLERLRRGCSGIMGSPDFVHFRKSLWPEFCRWCPPSALIPKHRYRLEPDWEPTQPFKIVFVNKSWLLCGGFDRPGSWEGPNINFAHFDEARHHPNGQMAKVLDGRCRITGPSGELPQWWLTTTPRKSVMSTSPDSDEFHWMYLMFGPWHKTDQEDPYARFKQKSRVTTLLLRDNIENLDEEYVNDRADSLSGVEESILVNAEWADEENLEPFLKSITWWDACKADIPPLDPKEPLIVALDAATGRQASASDNFCFLAISPSPTNKKIPAVREVKTWRALAGHHIDFVGDEYNPGPETFIRNFLRGHNVLCVVFDPHQLVSMAQHMEIEENTWFDPFGQVEKRLKADKFLLDQVVKKEVAHDGNEILRNHINNADRKVDDVGSRFRIVKGRGPIDAAVCLSMAVWQFHQINI